MADVDVVVIGSGAGGMAAAVGLANAGQSVAVFEQHELPGGWCHSFDLEGYRFSPGVHYLGELGEGGSFRRRLEGLGLGADLSFCELDPAGYDRLRVGDVEVRAAKGVENYCANVVAAFPDDEAAIRTFFDKMVALATALARNELLRRPRVAWEATRPLATLLQPIRDPRARSVLALQGGDHGMPPSTCPAVLHAGLMAHYFDGAWAVKGGARALPKAAIKQLRRQGGQIRVNAPVQRILVEGGTAIGVRLADGTEVRARAVVSNADPAVTFGQLLPADVVPARLRRKLRTATWSVAAMSLFLAGEADPADLGLSSANLWALRGDDVEAMYRFAQRADPLAEPVPGFFLTCTTAKDQLKRRDGHHTYEVFTLTSYDAFAPWAHTHYGERPAAYEQLKEALADRMLEAVDAVVPGFSEQLVFRSVGTPLTNKHYVAAHRGAMYGTEKRLGQLGPMAWPLCPMPGLYLCGASTLSHGVAGATASGVAAAAKVLGVRSREVLRRDVPAITLLPAAEAFRE